MKFIDLTFQNNLIKNKIINSINKISRKSNFIMGDEVFQMEEELLKISRSKYCISVASGTDALMIALMSLNIKLGDEVITTPFTWISTAEVIKFLGAKPIFVDVDYNDCNINLDLLEKKNYKKDQSYYWCIIIWTNV